VKRRAALSYGLIPVTVHFDDLDALGMLHNARYPLIVERAWTELWEARGVRFCSADGAVTYAHGTRALGRLDAVTLRPAPWSDRFRAAGQELLRPDV
jgi:acyl-CoA thioester hydrolase